MPNTSSVQTVPLDVIRVNLDGTSLAPFRKAWQLYDQATGLSGATAPVAIASATWAAGLTVVTVFDGEKEIAYYCGENTGVGQATFNYWKNTFVPRTTFGNPGTPGSSGQAPDGTLYEIYAVRIPGAADIAGLCAANQ